MDSFHAVKAIEKTTLVLASMHDITKETCVILLGLQHWYFSCNFQITVFKNSAIFKKNYKWLPLDVMTEEYDNF